MRPYFDAIVIVALFMHDTFSVRADEFGRSHAVVPVVSDFGAAEFSSAIARRMVLRASPVATDAAVTPPWPIARASLAANSRRPRSSRNLQARRYRARMSSMSITPADYPSPLR